MIIWSFEDELEFGNACELWVDVMSSGLAIEYEYMFYSIDFMNFDKL